MDWHRPRVRLLIVAGVAMLWMGAALSRLAYLQLFRYSEYLDRAERQQQRTVEVSPHRGVIYDRNLHELAMSISVDSCFAIPSEISDPDMVARLLSPALNMTADEVSAKLATSSSFAWIARKLPPEQADRIKEMNLRGIYFIKERKRFYPKRELAAADLGYVDLDEKGSGGIEYALDSQIRGRPGRMMVLTDAHRRWYQDSTEQGAQPGSSVVLTIDQNIQFIAEKELSAAIDQTRAKAGTIVVEDTNSGEILAMASWPTFNPNDAKDAPAESRMNRAIGALYEPGSVFKVVTLAAAIDQGITQPDEVVDCQMGSIYLAGRRIHDWHPFGLMTVADILAHSSDVGTIKIGLRLGAPKFYDYIRAFGFGAPTGVDLPGENRGLLRRLDIWTPISIGSISMGQEVGVTAMQLISAVNAIADGGFWIRPHIVRGLRHDGQLIPEEQPASRRVVSDVTAATMRMMLEGVVLKGTGRKAQLDGYRAAGKTGTAQKIDPATGRYSKTQLIASFVGFAPVNNPAVTVLITLDSPVGLHEGGQVSAPVFKRVAEQVLAYLNVPQDQPVVPTIQRASYRAPQSDDDADVNDFDPSQTISAEDSTPEAPQPAAPVSADSPAPTVALTEGDSVTVPVINGKTVRETVEVLQKAGLTPALVGNGLALEEEPEAGSAVRRGTRVTVRFGRAAGSQAPNSRRGNHSTAARNPAQRE
jgi:cell division protein FtsI (penicillin-binding protein 3)